MIRELILPQLAMGMSGATIVEWAIPEGGLVTRDQPLVSIETEKVVTDLPAPYSGYVHHTARTGDTVQVEKLIGYIAETNEEYRALVAGGVEGGQNTRTGVSATTELDVLNAGTIAIAGGRVRASGLAKAIAKRHGLDLSSVTGSGPNGRIVRRDVEAILAAPLIPLAAPLIPLAAPLIPLAATPNTALPAVVGGATGALREKVRIPLTGMRKVIADRMVASKTTAAHTYIFFEVDATKLVVAHQTMLDKAEMIGTKVSLVALQVKALALACRQVPICNATINGDAISVWDNVNVGIAVALPGKTEYDSGLVVPVVRNAHAKSVLEIDAEVKSLVGKARKGKLTAEEMADGTITLSSTGGFAAGVWAVSTPLINLPQVVNFQPGTPVEKPVVVDGQIVVRTMLPCGFSFDHRAMDGEPVSRFGEKLINLLGHPELMLL